MRNSAPILSICIPTHHGRAKVLQEAIDSILKQAAGKLRDKVEICIGDNASADGTKEMVEKYCRTHKDLVVYHRHETDQGFIRNLIYLVKKAKGDYCWLLGSDDQIADEGIMKALQVLAEHPDTAGVAVNWTTYDKHMKHKADHLITPLLPEDHQFMHVYTSPDSILLHCGMIHTLVSGNIVARKVWQSVVDEVGIEEIEKYVSYPHLYVLGLMAKRHPKWIWHPDKLLKYRADGASSAEYVNGEFHTFNLNIMSGISQVWAALLGKKSPTYKTLMHKQALYAWQPQVVRWFKRQPNYNSLRTDLEMLKVFTKHLGFLPEFWFKTFPILLVPHHFMKSDFFGYHIIRIPQRAYNSFKYRSRLMLGLE